MGNIEIRDQSNSKRRTQIFTDRKSYDAAKSDYRKSLTQRYQKSSRYSPIRFSKTSDMYKEIPLTQRKANTYRLQIQNDFNESPVMNQQSADYKANYRKSLTMNSNFSKNTKIRSFEMQNQPIQMPTTTQRTGKIVSNSIKRVNEERNTARAINHMLNNEKPVENPLQTRQIIRKVRNFNDFLNEIKRKLKQDKQQTLVRDRSKLDFMKKQSPHKQGMFNTFNNLNGNMVTRIDTSNQEKGNNVTKMEKNKSMRRIQVALKLENQKLELEKYRKLVERELSKTHSIENISLCTRNSGQKILTIQYESILPNSIFSYDNSKASLLNKQTSQKTLIGKIYDNDNVIEEDSCKKRQQKIQQNDPSQNMLKKLKQQYDKMFRNILQLGKTIQKFEKDLNDGNVSDSKILIKESQSDDLLKSSVKKLKNSEPHSKSKGNSSEITNKDSNNKIQRIEGLFDKLNVLQQEYQQTDRQIRQAIVNSFSDSQLEETLQQMG